MLSFVALCAWGCLAAQVVSALVNINKLEDLPLDGNRHLAGHWLLVTGFCPDVGKLDLREIGVIPAGLANQYFGHDESSPCTAVCLQRGVPSSHIQYPIKEDVYHGGADKPQILNWVSRQCQSVEMGWVSYYPNPAIIYWIAPGGSLRKIANLLRSELHTFWTNTTLGHKFQIVDSVTNLTLGNYTALFHSHYAIGSPGSFAGTKIQNEEQGVYDVFKSEVERSHQVTRTFSEFGFKKGRLPEDVWASIQTYYYNNRNNFVREEFEKKGLMVNWYEVDPKFLGMPWGLKGYWQERLKDLVEAWIGGNVPLEKTSIYGMRRYEAGARLLTHVDRQPTHAVSLIVNIAQEEVRKPWYIEVYDHAYRLHMIEMHPGDIVYYESAKALHGRMTPLDSGFYVNLFTHYRPVGDPQWFNKPRDKGTPEPLIDIEGLSVPTLSVFNHIVKSGEDLLNFWKLTSPRNKKTATNTDKSEL